MPSMTRPTHPLPDAPNRGAGEPLGKVVRTAPGSVAYRRKMGNSQRSLTSPVTSSRSVASVVETALFSSTLTRVGVDVAVGGVVVALGAVGGTAVVPWDISPVAEGVSIHIDLRLHRSASNERGSGNSKSKKDLSQGSLMSLPKKNARLPEPSQGRCGNGIRTKKGAVSLSLLRKLKVPQGGTSPSDHHHHR